MRNVISNYDINEKVLTDLFGLIVTYIKNHGGNVEFKDLSGVIETDIYEYHNITLAELPHSETALSDGLNIYLHHDFGELGIVGRIYDLLHLGLGHFWQWNALSKGSLDFWGERAWDLASQFYLGKPDAEIKLVRRYEKEASIIASSHLLKILKVDSCYSGQDKLKIQRLYNDFFQTDLNYITHFYRTGEVLDLEDCWEFDAVKLPKINIDFPISPMVRDNKCIPLVRNHKNVTRGKSNS